MINLQHTTSVVSGLTGIDSRTKPEDLSGISLKGDCLHVQYRAKHWRCCKRYKVWLLKVLGIFISDDSSDPLDPRKYTGHLRDHCSYTQKFLSTVTVNQLLKLKTPIQFLKTNHSPELQKLCPFVRPALSLGLRYFVILRRFQVKVTHVVLGVLNRSQHLGIFVVLGWLAGV